MARSKPNPFQKLVRAGVRDLINQINGTKTEPLINQPIEGTEAWYRDRLAKQLNGRVEVPIMQGRIDILTPTELIEVKRTSGWKEAIGQVKSYGKSYPKHSLRIHLFGNLTERKLKIVQEVCRLEGITLTWE
jgi:hypothetical protein